MTTQFPEANADDPPPDGPLADLRRRIERARSVDRSAPGPAAAESGADPLELLRRRIASANDPELATTGSYGERAATAPPPLDELYARIDRARRAIRQGLDEAESDEAPLGDSLQTLRGRVRDEAERIGARSAIDVPRRPDAGPRRPKSTPTDASLRAKLGGEVLEMVSEGSLPGPARAEAIEGVLAAMESNDPERLREVLRVLVFPDE